MFKLLKKNKNYKLIIGLIIGFIFTSSIVVYAWYDDDSREVSYDNSNDWLVSTNVHDALIELHNQKGCPVGYSCIQKKSTLSPGDYVNYTPVNCSYTTDTSMTGYTSTQTISPCELTSWRVLSVNQDGTIDIISEYASSTDVYFRGQTGYQNLVGYLNVLSSQYETTGVTVGSRYFGFSNQTEYITDETYFVNSAPWTCSTNGGSGNCTPDPDDYETYGGGDKGYQSDYDLVNTVLGTRVANRVGTPTATAYWMASRYYQYSSATNYGWYGRFVTTSGGNGNSNLYYYNSSGFYTYNCSNALRPIVTLASGLQYDGVGSKEYPMEIDVEMATATFYYNSNSTNGETTIASKEVSCALNRETGECRVTIPSEVRNSVGTYNNAYDGLGYTLTSINNRISKTVTTINIYGDSAFYSIYSSPVNVYRPTSTVASANQTFYRNQWFTSTTQMSDPVLSTASTVMTNSSPELVSGYSFTSLNTDVNNGGTAYTIANAAKTNISVFYVTETKTDSSTATFYYSNSSSGGKTNSTQSGTRTTLLYPTSTSAATTSVIQGSITPPSNTAPYGTSIVGWSNSASSMSTVTVNTAGGAYYAVYRANVTNYYYSSSYTSRTLYRISYYGTATNYTTVLSTSSTGTSNYSTATGPGSSVWTGLSTGADTTQEYSSVAAAATSTATTLYTVYTFNVTYAKGSNVSSIGATSGSCKVTSSSTSCNVTLPSITPASGYTALGWSTTKDATSGNTAAGSSKAISSNGTTLYANVQSYVNWSTLVLKGAYYAVSTPYARILRDTTVKINGTGVTTCQINLVSSASHCTDDFQLNTCPTCTTQMTGGCGSCSGWITFGSKTVSGNVTTCTYTGTATDKYGTWTSGYVCIYVNSSAGMHYYRSPLAPTNYYS